MIVVYPPLAKIASNRKPVLVNNGGMLIGIEDFAKIKTMNNADTFLESAEHLKGLSCALSKTCHISLTNPVGGEKDV